VFVVLSPHSHGLTGLPKPDLVKRRPAARRFYLTELAVSLGVYIRLVPGSRQRC
jgi:hypothetical protein